MLQSFAKTKKDGLSIILVEQNTEKALDFGDQVIMLEAARLFERILRKQLKKILLKRFSPKSLIF